MTVMEQEITAYVERVRAALADLPPAQRDELTEDLAEHLAEVAAESGPLVDRLGEPEAYAAELRAAAGAPARTSRNLDQRVAGLAVGLRARLRALDVRLGPPLGYATASDYLRLLRPAWWLLRAYLAAMLLSVASGGTPGVLPRVGDSHTAGLILLAGLVVGSLWLGRNTERLSRWPRRLVLAGSVGLALFGLIGFTTVDGRARLDSYTDYAPTSADHGYSNIQDIFVYDSEGRLLRDVHLFDQDGNPIRLGWPGYCVGADGVRVEQAEQSNRRTYPYCPENAPFEFRTAQPTPAPTTAPAPAPTTAPTPATPSASPDAAAPGSPGAPEVTPSGDPATPAPTATAAPR